MQGKPPLSARGGMGRVGFRAFLDAVVSHIAWSGLNGCVLREAVARVHQARPRLRVAPEADAALVAAVADALEERSDITLVRLAGAALGPRGAALTRLAAAPGRGRGCGGPQHRSVHAGHGDLRSRTVSGRGAGPQLVCGCVRAQRRAARAVRALRLTPAAPEFLCLFVVAEAGAAGASVSQIHSFLTERGHTLSQVHSLVGAAYPAPSPRPTRSQRRAAALFRLLPSWTRSP